MRGTKLCLYCEPDKLPRCLLPFNPDISDVCSSWSTVTPSDKLLKLGFLTLGDQFDTAVCAIAHPTSQTKLTSPVSCGRTEIDALYSTAHDHVNSLKHRDGFLYEIAAGSEGTSTHNVWNAHAEHGTTWQVWTKVFQEAGFVHRRAR